MEQTPVNHGGRYQLRYRGTECLNCGHPLDLSDRYCPNCSQANSTKHLTVRDFFEEFLSSLITLDTRFVRSLNALFFRPGQMTLDFVAGRRKTYVNPFRFLLSVAIIYFLMLNFSGDYDSLDRFGRGQKSSQFNFENIPIFESENQDRPEETREALALLDSLELTDKMKKIEREKQIKDSAILASPRAHLDSIKGSGSLNRLFKKSGVFLTLIDKDTLYSYEEALQKYGLERTMEDKLAFGMADSLDHMSRQPGTFLSYLISMLPFATFFFLPVFTVFLWMVYVRKKYTYTDNLIFSFHNQAHLFILLIISFIIDSSLGVNSIGWFFLGFSIYLFLSMRRFYGQGWFITTLKYLFLNTVFFILAGIAMAVVSIVSILTY